jgi:predicted Zn-dependent peptidase
MEETRSVAGWLGSQELLLGRVYTVDEIVEQIEAVDHDHVMAMAAQVLSPAHAAMAVVGPFDDDSQFARLLDG